MKSDIRDLFNEKTTLLNRLEAVQKAIWSLQQQCGHTNTEGHKECGVFKEECTRCLDCGDHNIGYGWGSDGRKT